MARKKKKKSFGKKLFLILCIAIIIYGSYIGVKTSENGGGLEGFIAAVFGGNTKDAKTINVLIVGVSEDLSIKLTDTIMIARYNPSTQKAALISISRDTFVGSSTASANGNSKLNAVYQSSGIDGLKKKVTSLTGLEIDEYVVVNNNAVIKIVDAMGGVNFDVPIDMDYDDPTQDLHIHLTKGLQKIDGEKAEWLLRFRHNNDGSSYPSSYGDNDYGRMRTQREFLKEMAKQLLSAKNIFRAGKIVNAALDNTDTSVTKSFIGSYLGKALSFSTDNIITVQLEGSGQMYNKIWFSVYNKERNKVLLKEAEDYLNTKIVHEETDETTETK